MSESENSIVSKLKNNEKIHTYTKGISMRPMLKAGRDISVILPVFRELNALDVVLYTRKKQDKTEFVLHRIIKIKPDILIIRGDNTFNDEFVPYENVIGILEGFFRKGKYIDCEKSKLYRFYSVFWTFIYPIRRFLMYNIRCLGAKIKNKLIRIAKRILFKNEQS